MYSAGMPTISRSKTAVIYCHAQGIPPVTLAEFALRQADGKDFYDVSLVDGYGLPVSLCFCLSCDRVRSRPWPYLPCCFEGTV